MGVADVADVVLPMLCALAASGTFVRPSGSSSSSITGTGRIRASRTPARSSHCPCRSWLLANSPALIYDDATDSVECFTRNIRHELHG
jgi:hypothetical protein